MKKSFIYLAVLLLFLAVIVLLALWGGGFSKLFDDQNNNSKSTMMKLTSPYFFNNNGFPEMFTCDGSGVNPPLDIADVPHKTKSLALVLRDPDAVEGIFIHWALWNINPKTHRIEIDSVPKGAVVGRTTNNKTHYFGPCPPSGTHRYIFTLYALDIKIYLKEGATVDQLNAAMAGHIITQTDLMAKYR
jgi:Raf kinase inhibitor-like YbhB/YbcL family protein